jgi:ketosteroid isomerase-like protein
LWRSIGWNGRNRGVFDIAKACSVREYDITLWAPNHGDNELRRRGVSMKKIRLLIAVCCLSLTAIIAQSTETSARAGIDAGNKAWIDGVKNGDVALIISTYAKNAVDCGPEGECIRGRSEIEQHMKTQLASLGRARSAIVKTWGSTQHENFAYEWGQAEATFDGGKRLVEKYLTVWRKQTDGSWKIFRNLVIPKQ